MIFLFPLDVGPVLDPLFGADVVVVVVVVNDLNAPLLCAALREVLRRAGCTLVTTVFSEDSKSLLTPRMTSQTDLWADPAEWQEKRQIRWRAVEVNFIFRVFDAFFDS